MKIFLTFCLVFFAMILHSSNAEPKLTECEFCTNVVTVANALFVLGVDPELVTGAVSLMCFMFPDDVETMCETLGQDVAEAVADEYDGGAVDVGRICGEIVQVC